MPQDQQVEKSKDINFFFSRKLLWPKISLAGGNKYLLRLIFVTKDSRSAIFGHNREGCQQKRPLSHFYLGAPSLPTSQTRCNPLLNKNLKHQASTLWQEAKSKEKVCFSTSRSNITGRPSNSTERDMPAPFNSNQFSFHRPRRKEKPTEGATIDERFHRKN